MQTMVMSSSVELIISWGLTLRVLLYMKSAVSISYVHFYKPVCMYVYMYIPYIHTYVIIFLGGLESCKVASVIYIL